MSGTFEDDILRNPLRTTSQDMLALAYCHRRLDGDALTEVVAMLELDDSREFYGSLDAYNADIEKARAAYAEDMQAERPTCPVTVWNPHLSEHALKATVRPCGQPTVGRLCADHESDRLRLGGVGDA